MAMNEVLCIPKPFTVVGSGGVTNPSNLGNERLGRTANFGSGGAAHVVFDLGAVMPIDTFAMLATDSGGSGISWQMRAYASQANAIADTAPTYTGPANSSWASPEAAKRIHRSSVQLADTPVSARYWRVTTSADMRVGRFLIGDRYTALDTMDIGFSHRVVDYGENKISQTALETANVRPKVLEHSWAWTWLSEQEARGELLDILAFAGMTKDVLCVLNPDAADLHNVIGYGRLTQLTDLINVASGQQGNAWQAKFSLRSRLILNL